MQNSTKTSNYGQVHYVEAIPNMPVMSALPKRRRVNQEGAADAIPINIPGTSENLTQKQLNNPYVQTDVSAYRSQVIFKLRIIKIVFHQN